MKPIHNGKTPNKLSYSFWNIQAFFSSSFSDENKKTGKSFAKSTGIAAAATAGIFLIPSIAIVSSIVSLGLLGGATYFGLQAYHTGKLIENSASYKDFIKNKEKKWKEFKSGPVFKQRFLSKLSKTGSVVAYALAIGATALATGAALVTQGIITAPLLTSAMSTIASLPVTLGITTVALALPSLLAVAAVTAVVTLGTGVALSFKTANITNNNSAEKPKRKSIFKGLSFGKSKTAINDNSAKPAFETAAPKKVKRVVNDAAALERKQRRQAAKANRK